MGHKEDFKVMIGGAASSRNWAEEIGADAYGADAQDAVEVAIDLLKK
jgi:methanogenic corrinoid protein MtbC1